MASFSPPVSPREIIVNHAAPLPCGHNQETVDDDKTVCPECSNPITDIRNVISETPSTEAMVHFERGRNLVEEEKWDEAASAFISALSLCPKFDKAQIQLDFCLQQHGKDALSHTIPAAIPSSLDIPGDFEYQKGLKCEKTDVYEAFLCFQNAALKGHRLAQAQLGFFYTKGIGVAAHQEKAFRWFKKAADQGDVHAQCWLGDCYLKGNGVKKDAEKAFAWFKKAADQGEPLAACHVGICYLRNEGVAKDEQEAFKWFKKAAEKDCPSARDYLGTCYKEGHGVQQNHKKAFQWFRKAAEEDEASAQYHLGMCFFTGEGVAQVSREEALKWFQKAAEQDVPEAQFMLGHCYYEGKGVVQNFTQAFKWMKKAADNGKPQAQNLLGLYYCRNLHGVYWQFHRGFDERGLEEYHHASLPWIQKAAEEEYPLAYYYLGLRLYNGDGIDKNDKDAFQWFQKAAKLGLSPAQYYLGFCYHTGIGTDKNYQEALQWYRKAAAQQDPYALAIDMLKRMENTRDPSVWLHVLVRGQEKWNKLLGLDVGTEPPLPPNIEEILKRPCPVWIGKRIEETHMLTLIPKGMTFNTLLGLIKNREKAPRLKIDPLVAKELGDIAVNESHWVLMLRDIIPGKDLAKYPHYQPPAMLEAAICILMEYFDSGNHWFHYTYTSGAETLSDGSQVLIGQFKEPSTAHLLFDRNGLDICTSTSYEKPKTELISGEAKETLGIAPLYRL